MRLRFVTGNPGKAAEAAVGLQSFGIEVVAYHAPTLEIQADTLEAVARTKAESVRGRVPPPYFVEDAGLFLHGLAGFPGIYSAHAYRTLGCEGLLRLLRPRDSRRATFRAVIALVEGGAPPRLFAGQVRGRLATRAGGAGGFGFDPVFVADGQTRTFAQLPAAEKSRISHRGRALARLARHVVRRRPVEPNPAPLRSRKG